MGLFRALTVILVGMFSISLLKSDNIQKLPLPNLNKFLNEKFINDVIKFYDRKKHEVPYIKKKKIYTKNKKNIFYYKYLDFLFFYIVKYYSNLKKNIKISNIQFNKSIVQGFYDYNKNKWCWKVR